jgi:hypothetical protein
MKRKIKEDSSQDSVVVLEKESFRNDLGQVTEQEKSSFNDSSFTIMRRLYLLQINGVIKTDKDRKEFAIKDMLDSDRERPLKESQLYHYLSFLKDFDLKMNVKYGNLFDLDANYTDYDVIIKKKKEFSKGFTLRRKLYYYACNYPLLMDNESGNVSSTATSSSGSISRVTRSTASSNTMSPNYNITMTASEDTITDLCIGNSLVKLFSIKYFGDNKGFGIVTNFDINTDNGQVFLPIFIHPSSKENPKDVNNPLVEHGKLLVKFLPTNEGPLGFINTVQNYQQDHEKINCSWFGLDAKFKRENKQLLDKVLAIGDVSYNMNEEIKRFLNCFRIKLDTQHLLAIRTSKNIQAGTEIVCHYGNTL